MKTYTLYYHQNGRCFRFGAETLTDAVEIAGNMLRRCTTDKGGILYEKVPGIGLEAAMHWDNEGAIRVQCGDMVVRAL